MKAKFLAWLFIIFCAQIQSKFALENSLTFRNRGFDISKRLKLGQEVHGANGTLFPGILESRKTQGGKAGGANIVHHPSPAKSTASIPERLYFPISTMAFCITLALPFLAPF